VAHETKRLSTIAQDISPASANDVAIFTQNRREDGSVSTKVIVPEKHCGPKFSADVEITSTFNITLFFPSTHFDDEACCSPFVNQGFIPHAIVILVFLTL